jgi:hypothetical protein
MLEPCYAFANNDPIDQIEKIRNELNEVAKSYDAYTEDESKWVDVLMEIADVQVACETLMYLLGANTKERGCIRKLVHMKNDRRGYYDTVKVR